MRNSFIIFFLSIWIHFALITKGKYRRGFFAIILSLLIHLIIFLPFFLQFEERLKIIYNPVGTEKSERVSLQNFNFSTYESAESTSTQAQTQKQPKQEAKQAQKTPPATKPKTAQPTPKPKQDSKPKEQTQVAQQTQASQPSEQTQASQPTQQTQASKTPQDSKPTPSPKLASEVLEQTQASQPSEQAQASQPTQQTQDLEQQTQQAQATEQTQDLEQQTQQAQAPAQPSIPQQDSSPSIYSFNAPKETQKIQDLYGSEFGTLSQDAQQFIKDNLDAIGKITQKYLRYPLAAGKFGQQGMNIVEFYLHPNGDITELKLFQGTNFKLLDHNSLQTVRVAYKDYPRPSEKTKIRIRMIYEIY